MATRSFRLLRSQALTLRLLAVTTAALGGWYILATWLLNAPATATHRAMAWNCWVVGAAIALLSLALLARPAATWLVWLIAALGVWAFISPWVLGYAGVQLVDYDSWAVGAVIALCAMSTAVVVARGGPLRA